MLMKLRSYMIQGELKDNGKIISHLAKKKK